MDYRKKGMSKVARQMLMTTAALLAVLAVLGLVIAGSGNPPFTGDSHEYLTSQSIALMFGVITAITAALIPWRKWLKAAPWFFAGWVILFCMSFAFAPVSGEYRYVHLVGLPIDTWTIGWPVAALFLAWIRSKVNLRSPILLSIAMIVIASCLIGRVVSDAHHRARLEAWLGISEFETNTVKQIDHRVAVQSMLHESFSSARWIGRRDTKAGQIIPDGRTTGISSSIAAAYGKVVPIGILVLYVGVLVALASVWLRVKEPAKRLFLLVYGLWLCVPSAYNLAECLKLVPCIGLSVPLVSSVPVMAMAALTCFGIIWSLLRDVSDGTPTVRRVLRVT